MKGGKINMAKSSAEYTKREILKSFAYGATIDKVANVYGISKSEATTIKKDNAEEIKSIKEYYDNISKGGK